LNLEREAAEEKRRIEMETLYYELVHNLVFELTRLGIETRNLKMRVESIASRLEFNERRARALESVVVYKTSAEGDDYGPAASGVPAESTQQAASQAQAGGQPGSGAGLRPSAGGPGAPPEGPGQRSRRRRRRRGRRSGVPAAAIMSGAPGGMPGGP